MVSKTILALVATSVSNIVVRKSGEPESQTYVAPIPRSSSTCSGRRTTLTSGTSSAVQCRTSICPRLEAAAVCTRAVSPSSRIVPTMPRTVIGLTNQPAAGAGVTSSGSTRHSAAFAVRYCEYMAPPATATVRPSSVCASADVLGVDDDAGARFPVGSDMPIRPAMPARISAGTSSRTVPSSERWAVCGSAGPSSRPRSDGWIGAASTRRTTSSRRRIGNLHLDHRELEHTFRSHRRTQLPTDHRLTRSPNGRCRRGRCVAPA